MIESQLFLHFGFESVNLRSNLTISIWIFKSGFEFAMRLMGKIQESTVRRKANIERKEWLVSRVLSSMFSSPKTAFSQRLFYRYVNLSAWPVWMLNVIFSSHSPVTSMYNSHRAGGLKWGRFDMNIRREPQMGVFWWKIASGASNGGILMKNRPRGPQTWVLWCPLWA